MIQPFDIQKLAAQLHASRDPRAPTDDEQQHVVTLAAPTNEVEQFSRWEEPQRWCRENVEHLIGERWSRRRDRESGELVFSFSSLTRGVEFALLFR